MLTKLIDLFCLIFPHEPEEYVNAELVGGPHDGARYRIGNAGHMYVELSHRPDQNPPTEVTSIYEWNGLKWYFVHLGKTRPYVGECQGK